MLDRSLTALRFPNPVCAGSVGVWFFSGLRVLLMKTEPHKACFSSKALWRRNDLMHIRVTVFWPGLNLAGVLTDLTVSLSGESEIRRDNEI